MTREEIKTEMEKLNAHQRGALRVKFTGRTITYLKVDASDGHVTVQFGNGVTHGMWVGPRGGIRNYAFW